MISVSEENQSYLAAFDNLASRTNAEPSWLSELRRRAIDRFADLGFPTPRQEAWKYTSVAPITKTPFALAGAPGGASPGADLATPDLIEKGTLGAVDGGPGIVLAFVDGRLSEALSRIGAVSSGLVAGSLAASLASAPDRLEGRLAAHADFQEQPFTALNTAFFQDGAFVHIPAGRAVEQTIHIVFVSTAPAGQPATVSHPRVLVIAEAGSQARIVESYIGAGEGTYLTNAVTEIVAGDNAVIDHYKLQRESRPAFHVATIQANLGRDASVSSHVVSLGAALARNDINAVLDGEGASCTLNGLYLLDGEQHLDNHIFVDHARSHGTSRQLYKGVLGGRSRGVFDGTILVRQDAQKTDSSQENRNLILSEEALVDTKPTLKIFADDVKCSHAATIGQLDEQSMFYLRSRAIDEETARGIMIHAFLSDIVRRIKVDALRSGLSWELARGFVTGYEPVEMP